MSDNAERRENIARRRERDNKIVTRRTNLRAYTRNVRGRGRGREKQRGIRLLLGETQGADKQYVARFGAGVD